MTTYLVRLRPNAEPPASAEYTTGKVHILDPEAGRAGTGQVIRYAYMGAPTRCGRELHVVAQVGNPFGDGVLRGSGTTKVYARRRSDSRAVLHFEDRVQVDQEDNLCAGCFGPHRVGARWAR